MSTAQDRAEVTTAADTRVGRFSYDIASGHWTWDEHMLGILGLRHGRSRPSIDHLLACSDPVQRARVSEGMDRALTDGEPFHTTYCLSAVDGVDRWVLLAIEPAPPGSARPVYGVVGRCTDLTEDLRRERAEAAREAVNESARHRASIDQAIGTLMAAFGLGADQAFEMLRWWSQDRNVKVRDLAARLTGAASRGAATGPEIRRTFDALLNDAAQE